MDTVLGIKKGLILKEFKIINRTFERTLLKSSINFEVRQVEPSKFAICGFCVITKSKKKFTDICP